MRRKAFTLVELLVVITIIGVLAGLMFPVLARVREKGRQAQCANNLKELFTATMAYASNSGSFPYATTYQAMENFVWAEKKGWVGRRAAMAPGSAGVVDMWDDGSPYYGTICTTNGSLYAYVTDKRVYLCPTFAIELKKVKPAATVVPIRSYVMNWTLNAANLFSLKDGTSRLLFTELNTLKVVDGLTVTTVCVTDPGTLPANTTSAIYYTPRANDGAIYCATNTLPPTEGIAAYHNGKGNAVFADGHIESLYYSNTWAACNGQW